jgi:hypothetical protein
MKKVFLAACCLFVITAATAQEKQDSREGQAQDIQKCELTVYGKGGYSPLSYTLSGDGSTSGSIGGGAGLGFAYNINPSIGIVLGVEMSTYATEASFANVKGEYDQGKMGELDYFRFGYSSKNYKETQNVTLFSIPVMAQYSAPVGGGSIRLYASGGFKFGFPVSAAADITPGSVTATGYYGYEDVEYKNLKKHGFYTDESLPDVKENLELGFSAALALEAGARFTLTDKIGLYTGLYFDYGLNDIRKTDGKSLMEYNQSGERILMHSVLGTNFVDKVNLMSIGLKVSIGFKL